MDHLQPFQSSEYEGYFSAVDAAFQNGRVASTQKVREICWKNWCSFVIPLVVEPWLHDATYQQLVWCLIGFASFVLSVLYGQGKQVAIGTVSGVLSDVGTTIAFVYEDNLTEDQGEKHLVP